MAGISVSVFLSSFLVYCLNFTIMGSFTKQLKKYKPLRVEPGISPTATQKLLLNIHVALSSLYQGTANVNNSHPRFSRGDYSLLLTGCQNAQVPF